MKDSSSRDPFPVWLEHAKQFCQSIGVHEELWLEIYQAGSDWEFILKIDALLETACKHMTSRFLKLTVMGKDIDADKLDPFIQTLPMGGRTSVLALLKISGCPRDHADFIESVRRIRNAFAHDIRKIDASLLNVMLAQSDAPSLLRRVTPIQEYAEKEWLDRSWHAPLLFLGRNS